MQQRVADPQLFNAGVYTQRSEMQSFSALEAAALLFCIHCQIVKVHQSDGSARPQLSMDWT